LVEPISGSTKLQWIDADQDADAIHNEIRSMLARSRESVAEEWAIHDYEGFFGLHLHEYESIERVADIANFIPNTVRSPPSSFRTAILPRTLARRCARTTRAATTRPPTGPSSS
jgi:hypothetical protein